MNIKSIYITPIYIYSVNHAFLVSLISAIVPIVKRQPFNPLTTTDLKETP